MSSSSLFEPLEHGQIRLLTIEMANDTPTCNLTTTQLKDAKFFALSYVWGDGSPVQVQCNNVARSVTANLYEALKMCHSILSGSTVQRVWIDALCINQDDISEKATQIAEMGKIYGLAEAVIAFLGPAEDDSDLVMDCISFLCGEMEGILKGRDVIPDVTDFQMDKSDPMWSALLKFVQRPYWQRLWVFQEILLAKDVTILCGSKSIPWDILRRLLDVLVQLPRYGIFIGAEEFGASAAFDTIVTVRAVKWRGLEWKLSEIPALMYVTRRRLCTLDVDRLWALMGILEEQHQHYLRSSGWIAKSYEDSSNGIAPWKTHAKVLKALIDEDYQLNFLWHDPTSPNRPSSMPSWLADWSDIHGALQADPLTHYHAGFIDEFTRRANVSTLKGCDTIEIQGCQLDTVAEVVNDTMVTNIFKRELKETLYVERQCLALCRRVYNCGDNVHSAHWRTLIANNIRQGPGIPKTAEDSDEASYFLWKQYVEKATSGQPDHVDNETTRKIHDFHGSVRSSFQGRKFFSTMKGRVGLGPEAVRPGDSICLFDGGAPLFLVRYPKDPVEEETSAGVSALKYNEQNSKAGTYMGPVYVHGLMYGEALQMTDYTTETIRIE